MRYPILLIALLEISCGIRTTSLVKFAPEVTPQRQEQGDDGQADAEEYFRRMRMPLGGPLQPERYLAARQHAEGMRHFSIAAGRMVTGRGGLKAGSLSPAAGLTGGWISLGPGNIGGRTRSLIINPASPNIMYAGAVAGGVWKSLDAGASWQPLTDLVPTDYISTLALDPGDPAFNTVYAGTGETFSGDGRRGLGILKTTDGGATWSRLPATANSNFYFVNKVVVTPSRNIYAATNTGVYQSKDGGNTWTLSLAKSFCYEMTARTDQKTDYLFATCVQSGSSGQHAIFRNQDAFGSGAWENVFTASGMARTSMAIAPSQPTTMYAMAWSTNPQPLAATGLIGVFRSTSSGDAGTWTTQTSNQDPNRLNTALLSNPQGLFADVCSNGMISYSGQGSYDNVLAVDPVNPDRVWAGGVDVFRSDDAGANWGLASYWNRSGTEYAHADRHVILFHPNYNGTTNQTLYLGSDGGLFRTDNATATVQTDPRAECFPNKSAVIWTSLDHHYPVAQFYYGHQYPGGAAYMGGTQDNGTLRGLDATGTEAWQTVSGGDGGWVAIDPVDPNTIYYEYVNATTYRSSNAGASTFSATHGITEPSGDFQFLKNIAMDPSDPQRLYVGGKTLWRTIDGAKSWTEASAPVTDVISAITVAPSDPNFAMFSGTSGAIYYSHTALRGDRTSVWSSSTPRANATAQSIAIDTVNLQVVYATYPAFKVLSGDNHVYKSTDGGQTWMGIDGTGTTGLPDVPVNGIVADPQNPQTIYVGTDLGIYVSLDAGGTWSRDVNPFVDTPVTALSLERGSGQTWLFAFTYGRGAWKVAVGGSGTPCSYTVPPSVAVGPEGGTGSIPVQTGPGCVWSVAPETTAVLPQSPAGGTGPGTAYYTAPANPTAFPRTSVLTVQGQAVTFTQGAADATATNDEVAAAVQIKTLPYTAAIGSNYTENPTDPVHSCTGSADLNTAWYQFTAPANGEIFLTQFGPAVLTTYLAGTAGIGNEYTCFDATNYVSVRYGFIVTQGEVLYIETSFTKPSTAARGLLIQMAPDAPTVSVSASETTLQPGGTAQLTAAVTGPDNRAVRWTISPPIGTISPGGLYTAPATIPNSETVLAVATSFADNATQGSVLLQLQGAQPAAAAVTGVQNAASYVTGAVSPGELVVIYGTGFGPPQLQGLSLTTAGFVDSLAGDTRVFFDGIPAPLIYATSGQLSAVVPYEVSNRVTTVMEVRTGAVFSAAHTLAVTNAAPGLFLLNPGGSTQIAMFNQDGTLNSSTNPAPKGTIVTCYGTGEGATNPVSVNGQVNANVYPKPLFSGSVKVGGQAAVLNYLGAAPNFVAGVFQLNFTVPASAGPGAAIPVTISIGGAISPASATMAVQ